MDQATISAPKVKEKLDRLKAGISRYLRGKPEVIDRVVVALIANSHVLIEDLPGLGKTTLAYCLARSIDCGFTRIQFTSDLLPSDVIGVSVYHDGKREFVFKHGPLFTNILLADEINRTTPKTQSALLEAMDRGKVSVDGQTYSLAAPFLVFATQNPVDFEGTFPLPESQMDRFLIRLQMGYPEFQTELEILDAGLMKYDAIDSEPILNSEEILEIQDCVPRIHVEPDILRYMLQVVSATRTEVEFHSGISTRGSLSLKLACQAYAIQHGRDFVIPDDVQAMIPAVCTHRLSLRRQSSDALEERHAVEGILKRIVDSLPAPV